MGCLKLIYEEERSNLSLAWKNPLLEEACHGAQNFSKKEALLADHLGNGRVWVKYNELTEQPEVIQQADYYPFGLQHDGKQTVQSGVTNNYQYNGSVTDGVKSKKAAGLGMEFVEDLGLNIHHAYYRTYDPALGRLWQIDPKAEEYYSMSPFSAFNNDPILYADPNGDSGGPTALGDQLNGLVHGIAFKIEQTVEKIENAVIDAKDFVVDKVAGPVGRTSDVVEVFTEKEVTDNSTAKKVHKATKKIGPAMDAIQIGGDLISTDFSDKEETADFIENTVQNVVEMTPIVGPGLGVIMDDSKKEDGVTNVQNLSKSYQQSNNDRNTGLAPHLQRAAELRRARQQKE